MDKQNTTRNLFARIARDENVLDEDNNNADPGSISTNFGYGGIRLNKKRFGRRLSVTIYKEKTNYSYMRASSPPSPTPSPLPSGFLNETYTLFEQMQQNPVEQESREETNVATTQNNDLHCNDIDDDYMDKFEDDENGAQRMFGTPTFTVGIGNVDRSLLLDVSSPDNVNKNINVSPSGNIKNILDVTSSKISTSTLPLPDEQSDGEMELHEEMFVFAMHNYMTKKRQFYELEMAKLDKIEQFIQRMQTFQQQLQQFENDFETNIAKTLAGISNQS